MEDVFVVSAVRTPVGKNQGHLREWTAPALLGAVLDEVMGRIDLDPSEVDDVVKGTVYQVGEQGSTLGRTSLLASRN
jgi:acetyl-CoA acyltransferase